MTIDLSGRTALVTGAGRGLGRSHALALARAGARVIVNDLAQDAADAVAREIVEAGGAAAGHAANVADFAAVEAMVADAMGAWGRVDILVNNAGILRDKSFAKMEMADFRAVMDVHVMGAVHCTKAVWEVMRAQAYGRIVMTTSSSGLYGNFGQSNYGAAKMALVGLMNTLAIEGAKAGIKVNCLAPTAATRMLEGLLPAEMLEKLKPEAVSPALLALVGEDAPTKTILCTGAGGVEQAFVTLTKGIHVAEAEDAGDQILARLAEIGNREGETVPGQGMEQGQLELMKAMAAG